MMWLLIDTHAAGRVRFAWLNKDAAPKETVFEGRASSLLPKLARNWTSWRGKLAGIAVVQGPGSFSSVRTGVLYANLLARLLQLPLHGLMVDEAKDLASLTGRLVSAELPTTRYAAPVYDAEPNITLPKTA